MTISPAALILLLLPVFAATNSLVVSVTGISFYKVFISVSFAFTLFTYTKIGWAKSRTVLVYAAMLSVFLLLGSLSILWAPDKALAFSKINNILFALVAAYTLFTLRTYEEKRFRHLFNGWIAAIVTTSLFAILELALGQNFFGRERFEDYDTFGHIVMSTFHNPNNFSVFLALLMPLILLGVLTTNRWPRVLFACLWLTSLALLVLSSSRVALFLAILQLVALTLLMKGKALFKMAATIMGLGMMVTVFMFSTNISEKVGSLVTGNDVSGISRITLVLNGIWMFQESQWLGVGAGNFPYYIENMNPPYQFREIIQPHNLWIEVLSEYGIVVFLSFVSCFLYLAALSLRLLRTSRVHIDRRINLECMTLLVLLITYPFAVLSPSHYVTDPVNWLFLTTVVLFAKKLRDQLPVNAGHSQSRPSPSRSFHPALE